MLNVQLSQSRNDHVKYYINLFAIIANSSLSTRHKTGHIRCFQDKMTKKRGENIQQENIQLQINEGPQSFQLLQTHFFSNMRKRNRCHLQRSLHRPSAGPLFLPFHTEKNRQANSLFIHQVPLHLVIESLGLWQQNSFV